MSVTVIREEVAAVGNPYKVVRRGGDWCVVKRDTGKLVPGGNHKQDKDEAMRHFRALEMAAHKE